MADVESNEPLLVMTEIGISLASAKVESRFGSAEELKPAATSCG